MGSRILVITPDVLAPRMAGPAIRAFHIAAALAADDVGHSVTLVSAASCSVTDDRFDCRFVGWHALGRFAADFDVLVVQGFATYHAPALLGGDQIVIVDLYDPLQFEQLEQMRAEDPALRRTTIDLTVRVLNAQAVRGDFFLCASTEQRHLWLGMLSAVGRVNPSSYDADPTLRSLIAVSPFGLSSDQPVRTRPAIRGVVEGIGPEDRVLLWAGGVYNWFDPLTLLRSVADVAARRPDIRLFFMGMAHPNPDVPDMQMAVRTRELAEELGLVGRHVFFNEGWVPFDERANFLLDADAGVSTHFEHAETAFAFRTRMLDYLWAGLPIVATEGDTFGRLIAQEGLGTTAPEQDVDALADAIERLVYDEEYRAASAANVRRIRDEYSWEKALRPLVEFCREPRRAADAVRDQRRILKRPVPPAHPVMRALSRANGLFAEGGTRLVLQRISGKLHRTVADARARRTSR